MEMESGKLFVGGISWDTNEDRLREYFQTFGEVMETVIMKDRNTGRARGFGFVVFTDPAIAERVVREKHIIDGRTVEAKKAVPREDQTALNKSTGNIQDSPRLVRTKKIFVGGLASTVTETDFKTYFDQFGTIIDVVVMYDHNTQRPRGFGFITYDSEEAVEKVLFKTFHELNGKMVEVKRAVPKEQSPSPNRNQLGGLNNLGPSRYSSFLNAYTQGGYNLNSVGGYGMRMDGRFSPIGRSSGYSPFGPSGLGLGLDLEPGFSPTYEGNGHMRSNIGYPRGLSSFSLGNQNKYLSPIGFGRGGSRPSSLISSPRRSMWENGGHNYSSSLSNLNDFVGSPYGNIRAIWGDSSNNSGQGGGFDSAFNGGNFNYGRNSDNDVNASSSFAALRDGLDEPFGNFNGGGSFYEDPAWRSSSPELEGSESIGFGTAKVSSDVLATSSSGYVDAYTVTNRPNRGIAA